MKAKIPCPTCGHQTSSVLGSRYRKGRGTGLRRRRRCLGCGTTYSTMEIPEEELDMLLATSIYFQHLDEAFKILRRVQRDESEKKKLLKPELDAGTVFGTGGTKVS